MSRKQYPVIGRCVKQDRWAKLGPGLGPVCCVCKGKATHRVDVQVSWFRGEDVVLKACETHSRAVNELLNTPEAAKQLAS